LSKISNTWSKVDVFAGGVAAIMQHCMACHAAERFPQAKFYSLKKAKGGDFDNLAVIS
jgi:mono/diheme cytochrome c family protein